MPLVFYCDKGINLSCEIKLILEGDECDSQIWGRLQNEVQF